MQKLSLEINYFGVFYTFSTSRAYAAAFKRLYFQALKETPDILVDDHYEIGFKTETYVDSYSKYTHFVIR